MKLLQTFILIFLGFSLTGQTWTEYYSRVGHLEAISEAELPVTMTIDDKRWSKQLIDSEDFIRYLEFKIKENFNAESFSDAIKTYLNLTIEYLNYYETEAKNLYLKGIIHGVFVDNNGVSHIIRASDDFKINNLKLSRLIKGGHESVIEINNLRIFKSLSENIIEKLMPIISTNNLLVKKAITFGQAKIIGNDVITAKNSAMRAALIKASEKSWGLNVESVTTMIDFGDISQKDVSSVAGIVITYQIIEEFVSDDGYFCLVLESIIRKP